MDKRAKSPIACGLTMTRRRRRGSMLRPSPIHSSPQCSEPGDYPAGKMGDLLTVEFNVMGSPASDSTAALPQYR